MQSIGEGPGLKGETLQMREQERTWPCRVGRQSIETGGAIDDTDTVATVNGVCKAGIGIFGAGRQLQCKSRGMLEYNKQHDSTISLSQIVSLIPLTTRRSFTIRRYRERSAEGGQTNLLGPKLLAQTPDTDRRAVKSPFSQGVVYGASDRRRK